MSGGGYLGKTNNLAVEQVGSQTLAEREAMWGEIDGEVKSFDPTTQTATIQPLYKPLHNGKPIDMPQLLKVPVRFPRSGPTAITHPVPPGTRVRLRPSMRSSENYHTEDDGSPSDTRSFNLSDMEAHIAGGESLLDPIENFDPDNLHIRASGGGNYGIRLNPDGRVSIEGTEGNIYNLHHEAVELCAEGFTLLGTEPALVHVAEYASIGAQLQVIADKLAAMKLLP